MNLVSSVVWRIRALQLFAQAVSPNGSWQFLGQLQAGLQRGQWRGDEVRKRLRLRHSRDLMQLGQDLIAHAERQRGIRRRPGWPINLRNGLMIAFLALRPLRLRNLVQLKLGEHLVQRQGRWWICIAARQTKGRHAIEMPFPDLLVPALELYLATARPLLQARASAHASGETRSFLWISMHGRPITERAAYGMIMRQTRIGLGTAVNPHAFRSAAATSLALESPADAQMAAPLLGHTTFAGTEKSYRLALQIETSRAYHGILEKLRGE